ncbi:MAG: LUD domain-containing protein [Gammaproteobacteria bacterium]|nr:LUD domain-containing protein [Gammaproteobacteria bacterium]
MTNSRREIFSRLQQASSKTEQKTATIKEYLSAHKRGVLPVYSENIVKRFISKAKSVAATVESIKNITDLSTAVFKYISYYNIEPKLVSAPDDLLKQVKWQKEITVEYRAAQDNDNTTLTMAYAGIAETGSLVLCSGKESPTTLNFMPDNNICIIQQNKIYPYMEDTWDLLRKAGETMPRSINFITGPSRTADVEQTIQLGAHGPRRLHIIILESPPPR